MTCIAWDGVTMAADKRACVGSVIRTTTKIWLVDNQLVGGSGDSDLIAARLDWFRRLRPAEEYPKPPDPDSWATLLVVGPGGVFTYERTAFPIKFEGPHFACGSGREYALAAMHLGKTAKEAVEVACALDASCGNGVDTLVLKAELKVIHGQA